MKIGSAEVDGKHFDDYTKMFISIQYFCPFFDTKHILPLFLHISFYSSLFPCTEDEG